MDSNVSGQFGDGLQYVPDKFVLEPTDSMASQFLAIDRSSGDFSYMSQLPDSNVPHAQIVFGLVGILRLIAGTYAVVITGRQKLGLYKGHPIYRVTSLRVLSCNNNLHKATPEEKKDKAHICRFAEGPGIDAWTLFLL